MSMQVLTKPVPKVTNPSGATLRIVGGREAKLKLHIPDILPGEADGLSYFENEDQFGCARGILWAVALQVALAVIAVVIWKIRFFRH